MRVHGAFVSDDEVHRVVEYLKSQGAPNYIEGILEGGVLDGDADGAPGGGGAGGGAGGGDGEADPMYDQAVAIQHFKQFAQQAVRPAPSAPAAAPPGCSRCANGAAPDRKSVV